MISDFRFRTSEIRREIYWIYIMTRIRQKGIPRRRLLGMTEKSFNHDRPHHPRFPMPGHVAIIGEGAGFCRRKFNNRGTAADRRVYAQLVHGERMKPAV